MNQTSNAAQLGALFSSALEMIGAVMPGAVAKGQRMQPGGMTLHRDGSSDGVAVPFAAPELADAPVADLPRQLFDAATADSPDLLAVVVFYRAHIPALGRSMVLEGEHRDGRRLAFALPYITKKRVLRPATLTFGELVTLEKPPLRLQLV